MTCSLCGFDAAQPCDNTDCPLRDIVATKKPPVAINEDLFHQVKTYYASIRKNPKQWQGRIQPPVDFAAWTKKQTDGVAEVWRLWESGIRRVCGVGVTGFGKTNVAIQLAREAQEKNLKWLFLSHRRLLFGQTHKRFMREGVDHGCRAAGYFDYYAPHKIGQLAMIPSERASVKELQNREYHDAKVVIWDETHANRSGYAQELHDYYNAQGAWQLGLTATPVSIGHLYDTLLSFGRPSEMRAIGAVVPFQIFAPDEVDIKHVQRISSGEFGRAELSRRFCVQQVVGSIIEHLKANNPEQRPTLLFAPDVAASFWFCDQLIEAGITAAHVDGNDCYLGEKDQDGEPIVYRSSQRMREFLESLHKDGTITVVCNRFVFLMGVDWPFIEFVVFATAFGTVEMWLQACGRGGRQYAPTGKSICTVHDHGGNWHRHPSPNTDIPWTLETTNESLAAEQKARREAGTEKEPVLCPKCRRPQKHEFFVLAGKCIYPDCGFVFTKSVRMVIQTDGKLKKVTGSTTKIKSVVSDGQKLWNNMVFGSRNSKSARPSNFNQIKANFERGQHRYAVRFEGDTTVIFDRDTSTSTKLGLVPAPGSELWNQTARDTPIWKLQPK